MIGKGRQDSAKLSNWRPKATELGRFVSYLVGDGMDCLSQAECDALAHGLRRGWPNRRIHAPKAKALLSGSDYGRGFGSVFHHHNLKSQPLSGWDFFARSPSVGAVLRLGLLSKPLRKPPFQTRIRAFFSLFSAALLSIQAFKATKSWIGAPAAHGGPRPGTPAALCSMTVR